MGEEPSRLLADPALAQPRSDTPDGAAAFLLPDASEDCPKPRNRSDPEHNIAQGRNPYILDRRATTLRRKQASQQRKQFDAQRHKRQHIIPRPWWFMAIGFGLSFPMTAFLARSLPTLEITIYASLALILVLLAPSLVRIERRERQPGLTWKIAAWTTIVMPMVSYAYSLVLWVDQIGLSWSWLLTAMITLNYLAFALLPQRQVAQVACLGSSWAVVTFSVGTIDAIAAFVASFCFICAIARYQINANAFWFETLQMRERRRHRAEDIMNDYEETGQGWFWEVDRRGCTSYLSQSVLNVLGRDERAVIGKPFLDLFHFDAAHEKDDRTLSFHLSARSSFQDLSVRAASTEEERWWSISGRPAYDDFHNFIGFRGSGTDLTEQRRNEANVARLAKYDSLTGLANRFQMQQILEKTLSAPQPRQRECNVMLLDLDRFKYVNDTFGHPVGDKLLKQIAQRLERSVDLVGRVGRLGGDEFQIAIPGRMETDALAQLAQDIIHSVSQPYSIDGQRIVIGASIGMARSPENGTTGEMLVRNADLALYAAKDAGRGRHRFYSQDLHSAAEDRAGLERDLREALARGELQLHYQPVITTNDGKIAGFEALLRWNHPERGWIAPATFIPIAEDTGLILSIGEWAIRMACTDLSRWPDHIRCAINVSPLQFANSQTPAIIAAAIAEAGIAASRIELEITENVFLQDDAGSAAIFKALKRVGIRLALDDFGTGYSSLGHLEKGPFDTIKIDHSFVRGAAQPENRNGAIIRAITSLARSLGMDTTAEGVERLDELALVRKLGCSHVQGHVFSKAVNADAATLLIDEGRQMPADDVQSSRNTRYPLRRKIMLYSDDESFTGTICNISSGGAMVEGLRHIGVGTELTMAIGAERRLKARTVWHRQNRIGFQFCEPLDLSDAGLPVVLL